MSIAAGETVVELKREKDAVENEEQNQSPVSRQGGKIHVTRDLIT